jgi:hypothetical protein
MTSDPTPTEDVYRAAWDRLNEAGRRLDAALIASAHLLDTPFTNAPETSPWERSVKPAMYALREAIVAAKTAVLRDAEIARRRMIACRRDERDAYEAGEAAGREAAAQAIEAYLRENDDGGREAAGLETAARIARGGQ